MGDYTEQNLYDNLDFAMALMMRAKEKKKLMFIKGVTQYIFAMVPGDIAEEFGEGE